MILATLFTDPYKTLLFVLAGCTVIGAWGLREALVPDHISRWQRGAWGEEMTAKELKPLRRSGWQIRHDIQTPRGNYDHIAIGTTVYLLETKYLTDSELSLENDALRVRRIDQPTDSYLLDHLTTLMEERGRELWRTIKTNTGISTYVRPVVVLWGRFPQGVQSVRKVTYIHGADLTEWLVAQPGTLDREQSRTIQFWLSQYQ
jgi:hypothetical protein